MQQKRKQEVRPCTVILYAAREKERGQSSRQVEKVETKAQERISPRGLVGAGDSSSGRASDCIDSWQHCGGLLHCGDDGVVVVLRVRVGHLSARLLRKQASKRGCIDSTVGRERLRFAIRGLRATECRNLWAESDWGAQSVG